MNKTDFYMTCDVLLGQTHEPPKYYRKRGRWGPREPGSGRYNGFGLIRYFSSNLVHLSIKYPKVISKTVTAEEALQIITDLVSTPA